MQQLTQRRKRSVFMRMWKKICAVVTAGAICAMGLPWTVSAVEVGETGTYGDLTYDFLDDGTIEITGCDEAATEVEIPAEIDGVIVTSIRTCAFLFLSADADANLVSVTIPSTVTNIDYEVFGEVSSFTDIIVSENNAFYSSKDGVLFNKEQTELICYPYGKMDADYIIPEGVRLIWDYAFYSRDNLTSVIISDSVTTIGDGAFSDCDNLIDVTIPESVTTLVSCGFSGTPWLAAKQAENPLVIINHILIDGTTCVGDIIIPDTVTHIAYGAFMNCSALTSVDIPSSVTRIESSTFYGCSNLISVSIPDSVTFIGGTAFSGTALLNDQTDVKYVGDWAVECEYGLTDAVIKEGTKGIAEFAFNSYLSSVVIPDSVVYVGQFAFNNTSLLENQTGVKYADNWVVDCDDNIIGAEVKEGAKCIGDSAFDACDSLTYVAIPVSMTSIGKEAFSDCANLSDVYYAGTEEEWNAMAIREDNDPLINATIHFESEAPEITFSTGDIDENGVVDANDAYFCLLAYAKMSVGSDSGLTAAQEKAADVDGNGKVDANDAYYILLYYAKKSVGQDVSWAELFK